MGSLVPEISLSVIMTCESRVSHSPGPSCGKRGLRGGAPGHPQHQKVSRASHCGLSLKNTPNQGDPPPDKDGEATQGAVPMSFGAYLGWGGSYLVGLPDGAQWDPHRPHHGVPNKALVPHLHCQAQVQAIDLTTGWGRNWGHPLPICPSIRQGSAGVGVRGGSSRGWGTLGMRGAVGWGDPMVSMGVMQGAAGVGGP